MEKEWEKLRLTVVVRWWSLMCMSHMWMFVAWKGWSGALKARRMRTSTVLRTSDGLLFEKFTAL